MSAMDQQYLTPQQFSAATGVPLRTVWRWCREGVLPVLRLQGARQYRIHARALDAHLTMRGGCENVISFPTDRRRA